MPTVIFIPIDWMPKYLLWLLYPCWWYPWTTILLCTALLYWTVMHCAIVLFILYCTMISLYTVLVEVSHYDRNDLSPWIVISFDLELMWFVYFWIVCGSSIIHWLCEDQQRLLLAFLKYAGLYPAREVESLWRMFCFSQILVAWILHDYGIWIFHILLYYMYFIGNKITYFKQIFNTETPGKFKDPRDFIVF